MDKKQKIETIQGKARSNDAGYSYFSQDTKASVLSKHSVDNFDAVRRKFSDPEKTVGYEFVTDITVRVPFTRTDYEHFRPNEAIPRKFVDIVKACRLAYFRVGIIRNIVDMMTDFAVEDFQVVHPDKKSEAILRVWAKKVKLHECVEEFVRHLILDGNVAVRRITANLTAPVERQMKQQSAKGAADIAINTENPDRGKREIPWKYMFLNVISLVWQGGDIAKMAGERQLTMQISPTVIGLLRNAKEKENKALLDKLPKEIKQAILNENSRTIPLDMSKVYLSHAKKDGWDDWAPPFLISVLGDIYFKDKLRQAEVAALDGIINVIRIWKLGDHKEGILPNDQAIQKLVNILDANPGGGAVDIVWDTMIDMEEYYPPVDKILGQEKYEQVNSDILTGLGIPDVLLGGKGGNFSNSWIQLKTLIERLKYIRTKVKEWVDSELAIVSDVFGLEKNGHAYLNEQNLQDENINRKLIIGLLDRGIISVEAVLKAYGENFLLEVERIRNQEKILKDAGIEVVSPFDNKNNSGEDVYPGQKGRPSQTQDVNRSERTPKPRTTGSFDEYFIYGLDAVDAIDEYVIPVYMEQLGVSNARKLTAEQRDEIDNIRRIVLSSIEYGTDLTPDYLLDYVESKLKPDTNLFNRISKTTAKFITNNKNQAPTLTQKKRIEATCWAQLKLEKTNA